MNKTEKFLRIFLCIFSGNFPNLSRGWYRFLDRPPSSKILNKKIENYGKNLHFSPKIFGTEIDFFGLFSKNLEKSHQMIPPLVLTMMMRTIINTIIWDTQRVCLIIINFLVSSIFYFTDINQFSSSKFRFRKKSNQRKERKQTDWCILMLSVMRNHFLSSYFHFINI